MKARLSAIIIAFVLCLSVLAGCSEGSAVESGATDYRSQSSGPAQIEHKYPEQSESHATQPDPTEGVASETLDPPTVDEPTIVVPNETTAPGVEQAPSSGEIDAPPESAELQPIAFSLAEVPAYTNKAYVSVNGNQPYFSASHLNAVSFEYYGDLDALGRCSEVYACIGKDLMPTEERGAIGMVKPSGWHTIRYNGIVDGNYLYNRCHLIGYQLTGENANTKNLLTGTRYLNIEGMLPFENQLADYIKETGNHVMYRVTPIFEGDNLLASGVLMEGYSIEDDGRGICFCVYAYNVQPGIQIDYATGESKLAEAPQESVSPVVSEQPADVPTQTPNAEPTPDTGPQTPQEDVSEPPSVGVSYILNTNTKKFHFPSCSSVDSMKEKNKKEFGGTRDEAIAQGYDPCGRCHP